MALAVLLRIYPHVSYGFLRYCLHQSICETNLSKERAEGMVWCASTSRVQLVILSTSIVIVLSDPELVMNKCIKNAQLL